MRKSNKRQPWAQVAWAKGEQNDENNKKKRRNWRKKNSVRVSVCAREKTTKKNKSETENLSKKLKQKNETMNRTEGLVRRNKSRADNGNTEANSSTSNGGVDENDVIINERGDDDIDDNDSKETRLTLMEEVLLLGLKDKEVGVRFI